MVHGWASRRTTTTPSRRGPRTFIGAIALAALAKPLQFALVFFASSTATTRGARMGAQIAARLALALANVAALGACGASCARRSGRRRRRVRARGGVAVPPHVLREPHAAQHVRARAHDARRRRLARRFFHLPFRVGKDVDARDARAVLLLTASFVIFRCDTALLLAPVGAHMLFTRAFSLAGAVNWGARCVTACLAITIAIDTAMWAPPRLLDARERDALYDTLGQSHSQKSLWPGSEGIMWPEGRVFWFNTYENRSHEWGTYPFSWYFTDALPRAIGIWTPFVVFGAATNGKRASSLVALSFVTTYSFLPHKELRRVPARRWAPRARRSGSRKRTGGSRS